MHTAPTLSSIGTLIGDPTRAVILEALFDGTAWTAGELAQAAGVTPQTMSSHVRMLCDAGILRADSQGRHRYFRLASSEVASMLESLSALSDWRDPDQRKPHKRKIRVPASLRQGRTCYDHIAGRLGVGLSDAMIAEGVLSYGDTEYQVTDKGMLFFRKLDLDCAVIRQQLKNKKRKFAHQCLDWSERRYHIAGALGAGILSCCQQKKWLVRAAESRAVQLTPQGISAWKQLLGVDFSRTLSV